MPEREKNSLVVCKREQEREGKEGRESKQEKRGGIEGDGGVFVDRLGVVADSYLLS